MEQDGRCRAVLDVGVEAVFMGIAPGYKLEKMAQADKTADAGGGGAAAGAEATERTAKWSVFWRR